MSHGITSTDQMFSVRHTPWHGLGVVLDQYPRSIDEALERAGLGWRVTAGKVLVVKRPEWVDDFGERHPAELIPANGSRRTFARTPVRCSGSFPTSTRSSRTATRSASSTR